MTRNTCSRPPSHWMLKPMEARTLPSMPKAQWLTSSMGSKSRTTWHMSWPTLPAWSRTPNASSPTVTSTVVPQSTLPVSWRASACWAFSAYWVDPHHLPANRCFACTRKQTVNAPAITEWRPNRCRVTIRQGGAAQETWNAALTLYITSIYCYNYVARLFRSRKVTTIALP